MCACKDQNKIIYMDNAATTRLSDEAFNMMLPYLMGNHANPGAVYEYADVPKRAIAKARESIAKTLDAAANEIYFTSGGTEADNWALKGIAELASPSMKDRGVRAFSYDGQPHIITSAIEHHAVLNTCKWLEKCGCRVSYVKPDENGIISVPEIKRQICSDTVLISVMSVNNELGAVQPIDRIGALAHEYGIPFHTDAVASYGHILINVKEMNIDMLSASAHKFNGPKGVGFLYVNEKYKLTAFMHGGAQEQGRRAGTLNVAGIIGMASAAVRHHENIKSDLKRRRELDRYFKNKLEEIDYCFGVRSGGSKVVLNGPEGCMEENSGIKNNSMPGRLPGTFNMTIPGIEAEELIVRLGMEGICVSAQAACASLQGEASHVLTAIGLNKKLANSTIRISMNEDNTEEQIDALFEAIQSICNT